MFTVLKEDAADMLTNETMNMVLRCVCPEIDVDQAHKRAFFDPGMDLWTFDVHTADSWIRVHLDNDDVQECLRFDTQTNPDVYCLNGRCGGQPRKGVAL